MIVDNRGDTTDIIVCFEKPFTNELQAKFDYILDQISELEYDYGQSYENTKRLG